MDGGHHHNNHQQQPPQLGPLSLFSGSSCSSGHSSQTSSPDPSINYHDVTYIKKLFFEDTNTSIPVFKTRNRSNSGTIFSHRNDFSSFNILPMCKINSYHIKMEDDLTHGSDDLRNFILSTLSSHKMSEIKCILCQEYMKIYDKYPLLDGTFFLSPRQHSSNGSSVPVILKSPILSSMSLLSVTSDNNDQCTNGKSNNGHKSNHGGSNKNGNNKNRNNGNNNQGGKQRHQSNGQSNNRHGSTSSIGSNDSSNGPPMNQQYLQAVCMSCLEGWRFKIQCRSCHCPWTGSNLTLGSMYSYDIFAALPCCVSRYACNGCSNPIMSPDRRLEFFSDYSQKIPCPSCGLRDHHFVKPLGITFTRAF